MPKAAANSFLDFPKAEESAPYPKIGLPPRKLENLGSRWLQNHSIQARHALPQTKLVHQS